MRIGLIADTRIPGGAKEVPAEVDRAFEGVDLILHAGGIYVTGVLNRLERIAPVKAAGRIHVGHAERPEASSLEGGGDARVAEEQILKLEGHTIGLVNNLELRMIGDDILPGMLDARRLPDGSVPDMVEELFGAPVDIVVFGRTLYAMVEEHQGILFINPGSPTLPKNLMKLGNVAILDLTPDRRDVQLIDLADFS